jgi:signal transduction histidine kinase
VTEIISKAPGPKWAPQIVVLLDDEARVLSVNRSLAGNSFDSISENAQQRVHSQLHLDCDGKCRFNEMWNKAWPSLTNRDSIEWELDDPKLSRVLRLNLSKTPAPNRVAQERRRRHKLLTITDITKYRREYETLVEQQQALIRLLMAQGLKPGNTRDQPFDETGDSGSRLMAGYVNTERSLSRQLILAQEKERKRIASELHDGIAQTIGVVKYRIEDSIVRLGERYPDLDLSILDGTVGEIRSLLDEVRRISNNLSPSMLEDFGLHVALDWLCKEFKTLNPDLNVDCGIRIDESDTPELIKIAIYRVAQEALHNVSKHASATHVNAFLESTDGSVNLVISDDGIGFDPDKTKRSFDSNTGLGVRSMRERVEATGGTFILKSAPKEGVEIHARWAAEQLSLIQ